MIGGWPRSGSSRQSVSHAAAPARATGAGTFLSGASTPCEASIRVTISRNAIGSPSVTK